MLPPLLLFALLWRRGRITRPDAWRLVPFFALSLLFGVMSAWFQKYQVLGGQPLPAQVWQNAGRRRPDRLVLSGQRRWPAGLNLLSRLEGVGDEPAGLSAVAAVGGRLGRGLAAPGRLGASPPVRTGLFCGDPLSGAGLL